MKSIDMSKNLCLTIAKEALDCHSALESGKVIQGDAIVNQGDELYADGIVLGLSECIQKLLAEIQKLKDEQ